MKPHDGFPCLVCDTRTTNEGQLCTGCVEKGHRRINDELHLNLTPFLAQKGQEILPGIRATGRTTLTLMTPVPSTPDTTREESTR